MSIKLFVDLWFCHVDNESMMLQIFWKCVIKVVSKASAAERFTNQ